ncbi:MAG: hypothetical protein IJ877_07325 [Candidatus Gastranaerophilales bacterium]|nr:hypothetical protein [Candidatus Gastranaerophilales bacterium]
MANFKIKNFFLLPIFALFFITAVFADGNIVRPDMTNWEEIYNQQQEADFDYIFGLDPYQSDEYTKYMYSPYPLFRLGVPIIFKSITIQPGYYLLTPRDKNGQTWILFKENGRVSHVIPIYKEETVPDSFWEEKLPHPKLNAYEKVRKNTMNFIGKKFGSKNQRTPIPSAYIEFDDKGDFWNMILYYGSKKYYLIFKKG